MSVEIVLDAIKLYAAMHPTPSHVNQGQAAEMLGLSVPTVRKLIKAGTLKLNKCGLIPVTQIYSAIREV